MPAKKKEGTSTATKKKTTTTTKKPTVKKAIASSVKSVVKADISGGCECCHNHKKHHHQRRWHAAVIILLVLNLWAMMLVVKSTQSESLQENVYEAIEDLQVKQFGGQENYDMLKKMRELDGFKNINQQRIEQEYKFYNGELWWLPAWEEPTE